MLHKNFSKMKNQPNQECHVVSLTSYTQSFIHCTLHVMLHLFAYCKQVDVLQYFKNQAPMHAGASLKILNVQNYMYLLSCFVVFPCKNSFDKAANLFAYERDTSQIFNFW